MDCAAAESVEPKESECSVCYEPYMIPKLLPCGHLLCRHCLLTWMKTQDEACCPLCQDLIVTPKDRQSQSLEDLVSGFPTDLSMELVVEADRILSKQHTCCVCVDVAATAMCLDCKDMLCQSCSKAHGKLSATKHHTVEDLSTLTAEEVAANHSFPCSTHPEEIRKLFCPTHGASICLVCATSKHKSCQEVMDLEEKLEESHASLKQLMTTLIDGEQEFDGAVNELDEHLRSIEKSAEAAIEEIEKMWDDLEAFIKNNRQRLKEQVVKARCDIEEAVKEGRGLLLQRQTKLSTHRPTVQRVREAKNREVVTTMALKMKQRVNELNFDTILPKDAKIISTFRFIKNCDSEALTKIRRKLRKLCDVKMGAANVTANRKVQIDQWPEQPLSGSTRLQVGVADMSPATMTLSRWSDGKPWPAWICHSFTCSRDVQYLSNTIGAALKSLGEKSRVGLAVDSAHSLHLYVDGQDQGIAADNMPDPCYAMLDLQFENIQITALPVTTLNEGP